MKEEVKRREGDPLIRAKLRELQRENLKQAASVKRVPEAEYRCSMGMVVLASSYPGFFSFV
jgi:hypothetical protein